MVFSELPGISREYPRQCASNAIATSWVFLLCLPNSSFPRDSPTPVFSLLSPPPSFSLPSLPVYVYVLRKKNIKKELLTTAGGGDKLEEGIPGSMECTSRGWEYPGMSEELGRGKGNPHEVTIGVLGLFRGIIGGNPGSTKCIPRDSSSASLSPLAPRAPNSARGRAKKNPDRVRVWAG